jgi:hypothetical protein
MALAAEPAMTCTEISNDSGLGPARNQSGIGWCYAFTAAELVSHKLGYPISATDIAIGYNYQSEKTVGLIAKVQRLLRNRDTPVQAGDVSEALALNIHYRTGFCTEQTIPSSQFALFAPRNTLKDAVIGLSKMEDRGNENDATCNADTAAAHALFPRLSETEIYSRIRSDGLSTKSWYDLSEAACTWRIPLSKLTHVVKSSGGNLLSRSALLDIVDHQLELRNVIGLQYNPLPFIKLPWWETPDKYFTEALSAVLRTTGFAEIPTHAVTIIGRRMNPHTKLCEYQIRDSDNYRCERGREGICDPDGSIWYQRNEIIRHIHDIVYLED